MAKRSVSKARALEAAHERLDQLKKAKAPDYGLCEKEYQALEAAYALLLSGAGMLSTAVAALESGVEDLSSTAVSETALAALKQLRKANEALEHLESPLHKEMEAIRDPLWDVLDLVFVAAHVLDSADLPGQSEEDPENRPSSDHPEAALLRVAANMAAGRGLESVAAAVAQLQEKIRNQRARVAQ